MPVFVIIAELFIVFRQMNELRKSEDNQNREELKVLARQHSNKDELQRFAMFVLLMYP